MRRLSWKNLIRIVRTNYVVSDSARVIHRRWLRRQTFVLGLGCSILTFVFYPGYYFLTNEPGERAFAGEPHHVAVMVISAMCIVLPLFIRRLRQQMEILTFINLLVLFVSIAIDTSISDRPRRYTSLGLIPLFASTFLFTHVRFMVAAYVISGGFFVVLNEIRSRPGELVALYAIAHVAAFWMALMRIRSLQRISLDHARLYERRVYDQRVRLARNLHDSLGGDLTQLVLQLSGRTPRNKVLELAHIILAKTKNLVHTLNPLTENVRFRDFARAYVERMRQTGKIRVSLHIDANIPEMRLDHALNLQAVFTEWMTNTIRHSKARKIDVALRYRPRRFYLIISDDGQGFRWTGNKEGSGLRNIAVRADLMNARVFARRRSKKGGTIFFLRGHLFHD